MPADEKQTPQSPPHAPQSTVIAGPSGAAEPPPYAEDTATVEDDLLPACTLRLAGRFVHSSEGGPDSPPLYELSTGIGFVRETDTRRPIGLDRLDYSVKTTSDGGGSTVTARNKLIFQMRHHPAVTRPPFPYVLESASRSTMGNMGLRKSEAKGGAGAAYVASRVVRNGDGDWVAKEKLFEARSVDGRRRRGRRSSGKVDDPAAAASRPAYEWLDGAGRLLAVEDESEAEGMHRLALMVSLDPRTRDTLVGTWCLRLWEDIALRNTPKLSTWGQMKRILQTRTLEYPGVASAVRANVGHGY